MFFSMPYEKYGIETYAIGKQPMWVLVVELYDFILRLLNLSELFFPFQILYIHAHVIS